MTVIDIAGICLMALCVVVGVGEPLARRWLYQVHGHENGDDTERLLLQKEMVYGAIRDLDFDFQTSGNRKTRELRQQLEKLHNLHQLMLLILVALGHRDQASFTSVAQRINCMYL
jgi:hypothetical protein